MRKFILMALFFSIFLLGCTKVQQNAPPEGPVKEFTITANQSTFNPNQIVVNKNDRVLLHLVSVDEEYDFALDEFGITEGTIKFQPGSNANIEFIADIQGTFTFRCAVVCKGQPPMEGKIIVR